MPNSLISDVDIIIVTWKTKELTWTCVDSVLGVIDAEEINATVWVI